MNKEKCKNCNGDVYPYYGTAPNKPQDNFIPDPDCESLGTYTHCLECGEGK